MARLAVADSMLFEAQIVTVQEQTYRRGPKKIGQYRPANRHDKKQNCRCKK
jgi:hypothetical protein